MTAGRGNACTSVAANDAARYDDSLAPLHCRLIRPEPCIRGRDHLYRNGPVDRTGAFLTESREHGTRGRSAFVANLVLRTAPRTELRRGGDCSRCSSAKGRDVASTRRKTQPMRRKTTVRRTPVRGVAT